MTRLPSSEAAEAVYYAVLFILQLADKDVRPLMGESIIRALEQDGYTVISLRTLEILRHIEYKYDELVDSMRDYR